jgi:hypothetical protein
VSPRRPPRRLPAALAWGLAIACLALAAAGFASGRVLGPATQGYPGVAGAFFFLVLARVASLDADRVGRLGAWPLFAGGAGVCVAVVLGASGFFTRSLVGPALPLAALGCPLIAVAALRLSTAAPRPRALHAAAVALLALAVAATVELVRVWPVLRLGLPSLP